MKALNSNQKKIFFLLLLVIVISIIVIMSTSTNKAQAATSTIDSSLVCDNTQVTDTLSLILPTMLTREFGMSPKEVIYTSVKLLNIKNNGYIKQGIDAYECEANFSFKFGRDAYTVSVDYLSAKDSQSKMLVLLRSVTQH